MPDTSILLPFIIQGLAFGAMYAVTGTSIVVLYRTTGVVNLAFGAIGSMGVHIVWSLMGGSLILPEPRASGFAILLYPALVGVCALIFLIYGWFLAPLLDRRDALAKSLGTVALALFLMGIMKERWDTSKPRSMHFPNSTFRVGGTVVTTNQVLALLFALAVVIVVGIYLRRTETGTAMRAIANNRETSGLLGVPVRRVEAMAWFGAGILCGCVFLLLPSLFKSMDQATLTWFVIPALAGAIVGQLRSLWITFFASLLIGVVESVLTPFHGNLQFLATYRRLTPVVISVVAILWISRRRTVVLAGREMT
ncbi:branched-chain amino acid ABC transporter permease [Candidatus Poriferisodalis sp.]|uniref:branched-chain amino acid ABC transporter permease n=1 Tax=Candidatus Poriferisodalis sp. TaxID=3101277 RepID=UPI003AF8573C